MTKNSSDIVPKSGKLLIVADDFTGVCDTGVQFSKNQLKTFMMTGTDHFRESLQKCYVLLARVNHQGSHLDGTPEKVMSVLEAAQKNGKGVIGMKIFGMGDLTKEDQREKSLNYVIKSGNVHFMTPGLESREQLDDAVNRVMRIVNS